MDDGVSVPQCIGFIMDGNRRWAKGRMLPVLEGHRRGARVFEDTVRFLRDHHVPHAVFYAFSSENWNRTPEEVHMLTELFNELIQKLDARLNDSGDGEKKVRFRFVGELNRFGGKLAGEMKDIEKKSERYADTTIWIALSYGGRGEIVSAVNEAVKKGVMVDESSFGTLLFTAEMPDPDLIVRTGGQQRLSNFLPWQSVYSELLFLDKHWPDITDADLKGVLNTYSDRVRNFGK